MIFEYDQTNSSYYVALTGISSKARLVASRRKDATKSCIVSNLTLAPTFLLSIVALAASTALAMADAFATLSEEGQSCYSDPSEVVHPPPPRLNLTASLR
jgi:hypothetical protein